MQYPLKGLKDVRKSHGLPPVEKWNPPYCGELDIHIKRDGSWFYMSTPIGRPELVRLFSTILWLEDDSYFLVTPVEKVKIKVDGVPFLANDFDHIDGDLHFTTLTSDTMIAGSDHPIKVTIGDNGEPAPYIKVRRNLWALIDRKNFYRLVDLGETQDDMFGIRSQGQFFPIIEASKLKF